MNEEKVENIQTYLARSLEAFKAAKSLVEAGYFRDAASRAYYSMFYAATAALISVDVYRSKHSGVIAQFARYFVKTGRVEKVLGEKLHEAFDYREVADYEIGEAIDEETVKTMLVDVEKFLTEVKRCLMEWDSRIGVD